MARPITWLPRLHAIRRSVAESVRSHYSTKDIEQLFEVQPRSAQMLAALLPTVAVGNAQLVDRETLNAFLDQLAASPDPASALAAMRSRPKPPTIRRKLRELIQTDVLAGETGLPLNVDAPERGLLTIRYADMAELATALYGLSMILDNDLEGFATLYAPGGAPDAMSTEEQLERADAEFLRRWIANQ